MKTFDLSDNSIHEMLADRHEIALIWSTQDVLKVRPDLSSESAWEVLQACERQHDALVGMSWDVIRCVANELFPSLPPAIGR